MKKLTQKQRHEIYKKALVMFDNGLSKHYYDNICGVIDEITKKDFFYGCSLRMSVLFEELFLFNDKEENNVFWNYEDYNEHFVRCIILEFCIEMTK